MTTKIQLARVVLVLGILLAPVSLRAEMTAADCQRFYNADAYNHHQAFQQCLVNTGGTFAGTAYCGMAYAAWMAAANAAYQGCMSSVR